MGRKSAIRTYRGKLLPQQIADGMNAASRNAKRLCEDANLLLREGRYATSESVRAADLAIGCRRPGSSLSSPGAADRSSVRPQPESAKKKSATAPVEYLHDPGEIHQRTGQAVESLTVDRADVGVSA